MITRFRRFQSKPGDPFPEWDGGGAASWILLVLLLGGCASGAPAEARRTQYLLGTLVEVTAIAPNGEIASRAVASALDEIRRVEGLLTTYSDESEISRLNRSSGRWVELSPETIEALDASRRLAEITGGAFDPTVGPLIDLWREAEGRGRPPDASEIERTLSLVGYRGIDLDREGKRGRLEAGMRVDLGGIGKGYAVDRAGEALLRAGASGGTLNAGGDLLLLGALPPPLREVGIRDPSDPERILGRIRPSKGAVATSGNYERGYRIGGQLHGHVLDPATGLPVRGLLSATIVAADATTADALATAVLVRGRTEADRLSTEMGVDHVTVDRDGGVSSTLPFEIFP